MKNKLDSTIISLVMRVMGDAEFSLNEGVVIRYDILERAVTTFDLIDLSRNVLQKIVKTKLEKDKNLQEKFPDWEQKIEQAMTQLNEYEAMYRQEAVPIHESKLVELEKENEQLKIRISSLEKDMQNLRQLIEEKNEKDKDNKKHSHLFSFGKK